MLCLVPCSLRPPLRGHPEDVHHLVPYPEGELLPEVRGVVQQDVVELPAEDVGAVRQRGAHVLSGDHVEHVLQAQVGLARKVGLLKGERAGVPAAVRGRGVVFSARGDTKMFKVATAK